MPRHRRDPPPARSGVVARAATTYRALLARQRHLERWVERRYPKLYDARHAATGMGRALWPLLGPLLMALVLLPIIAVIAALVAVLDIQAPSIDLPSIDLPAVDLPSLPLPDVSTPGWLRAVGDALAAVFGVIGPAAKYVALACAAALGIHKTRQVRRKRTAAELIGRPELLRCLAVVLGAVEASALARGAATVEEASVRE